MSDINQLHRNAKAKVKAAQKALDLARDVLETVEEIKSGDRPSFEQARAMKNKVSYGVHFERANVLREVRSPGAVCKSVRRFSSRKEAEHHAKRFKRIHGHKSFTIVRVAQRANAWINWSTGKTNPVLNW